MYLFNGNVVFHVRKQQVSVEHVKLRRGIVIQGFCAENTALVFSLTLDDLSVLEPQGHHAAQKIMLLIFTFSLWVGSADCTVEVAGASIGDPLFSKDDW